MKLHDNAPINTARRLSTREFRAQYGGMHGHRRDQQFVFSCFRTWRTCRDDSALLTLITFLGSAFQIATGNHAGELKTFYSNNGNCYWRGRMWGKCILGHMLGNVVLEKLFTVYTNKFDHVPRGLMAVIRSKFSPGALRDIVLNAKIGRKDWKKDVYCGLRLAAFLVWLKSWKHIETLIFYQYIPSIEDGKSVMSYWVVDVGLEAN
eukprot:Gb_30652 [translate_table: standard]